MFKVCLLSFLACFGAAISDVQGAAPEVSAEELPRVPATPPEKALETFEVKAGFRLDLVAAEPLLVDPVAIAFDENGRMFVVEMVDYSERRDESLGQVRMLEDTDGDGVFDKTTVYADDLAWPTAVICYDGGIFVASSPDIIWFKDADGDGKAEERKVVFTGFGTHAPRLNVQSLLNNLTWGVDNRIHGATSRNGGTITSLAHPSEPPLELRSRDFSFDPRTLTIRAEAGGGQHGMSFDDRGGKYVSSNSHHLQAVMYEERYAGRNPAYTMPRGLIDIAVDGPAAEVYRISPDEPWRVIRTKWRVEGTVPGVVEGGGRVSGYFTGATGGTIYRGNALPTEFLGNAFIGDAGGNLVHRKLIRMNGVEPVAERPEDEQKVEFIASRDVWFRPVDFANAPDGGLYILDMYRETIEHPWSIPETIKKHLDLNSGNDRGRIYRVVPEGFEQPAPVRLAEATIAELVETLAHPNGWHRDTAARLLSERRDREAVPLLNALLRESESGTGRMHALYALRSLEGLDVEHLLAAMEDPDERVRQHAVRLAEEFPENAALAEKAMTLAGDSSAHVRYQLAFTLGEISHPERTRALAKLAASDGGDKWIRAAILSSLAKGAAEVFEIVAAEIAPGEIAGNRFLSDLIGVIATRNEPADVSRVVAFLGKLPPEVSIGLARALGEGLAQAGGSLAEADDDGALESLLAPAKEIAVNGKATAESRKQAIELLGFTSFETSGAVLRELTRSTQPREIQLAALQALDRFEDPGVAASVLEQWQSFSPRLRGEALTILLKRTERTEALLEAIRSGKIAAAEIPAAQAVELREHQEPTIREAAGKLFGGPTSETRGEAIAAFRPSLELVGNVDRGRAHYRTSCAACHRSGSDGYAVGPDLAALKTAGKESLLANIIDPNREVAPGFVVYHVETKDGANHYGMVVNETAQAITLRQIFGKEITLRRDRIAKMQSQGRSIMPEGLENGMSNQDMADLLEFILTADQ